MRDLVAPFAEAGQLELDVSMVHEREPFETPGDDPAVQAVAQAHNFVHGDQVSVAGKRIVGDANLYVNLGGVPLPSTTARPTTQPIRMGSGYRSHA